MYDKHFGGKRKGLNRQWFYSTDCIFTVSRRLILIEEPQLCLCAKLKSWLSITPDLRKWFMFSSYFVLIQQRAIAKWLHNNKSTINKTNSTKATKMLSKRARGRSRGAGRGGGRPLDLPLALFDSFLVALVELVCWSGIDKVLLLPLQYCNSQSTQNNCHT